MRNAVVSFFVVSLMALMIVSCSNQVVGPVGDKPGKVSLSFDKANMPNGIISVKATLSRDGYNTITQQMDLTSDTSATLTVSNLNSGSWHLKVEASDSTELVLYKGETDISILAGITTQVDLTLTPTGAGYGNIEIKVKWGVGSITQGVWADYPQNPIMTGYSGAESRGCSNPRILYENGSYKMYYTGINSSSVGYIMYATSPDGITWTKRNLPILSPAIGSWDSYSLGMGGIIKDDGVYKMYYTAINSSTGVWSIGLATSTDGINFTRLEYPIFTGTQNWCATAIAADILKVNGIYYLYIIGKGTDNMFRVGLLTSSDGLNFANPQVVLTNTLSWEGNTGLVGPSVIYENSKFKMVYTNYAANYIGYAESSDGKNWIKETNFIFDVTKTTNHWAYDFLGINFRKINNEYRIYYATFPGSNYSIGLLRK